MSNVRCLTNPVVILITAVFMSLVLISCGGGSSGEETTRDQNPDSEQDRVSEPSQEDDSSESVDTEGPDRPDTQENLNQAVLGPLSGAEIRAYRLSDLDNPVEGPIVAHESLSDIEKAGTFELSLSGIDNEEWILVTAAGGLDIDANDDGELDRSPTTNNGTLHAIGRAEDWRAGGQRLNVLTEVAFRTLEEDIRARRTQNLEGQMRWVANGLLSESLNGGNDVAHNDLLAYTPSYRAHQQKLITDHDVLLSIAGAIHNDDVEAVRLLAQTHFGDGLRPPREINLVTVSPDVDVPPNRQNLTSDSVQVRSLLSETAEVDESGRGTLLIAEEQGRTVLMGYSLPDEVAASHLTRSSARVSGQAQPEVSIRSTALAMIMLMAGSGLDAEAQRLLANRVLGHEDLDDLVAAMAEAFEADPYFLDQLKLHEDIVDQLTAIAQEIFNSYLEDQYREATEQQAIMSLYDRRVTLATSSSTELNKTFCSLWICPSPWSNNQPWDWYGSASRIDVWSPPFLAISSLERNRIALANPGMVNYSMALFDSDGERLSEPSWLMVPRNSTALQKVRNSGAAQRVVRSGSRLPTEAAYVEFHKHRFNFSSWDDGSIPVSLLNNGHLIMSAISFASTAVGSIGSDVLTQASQKPEELKKILAESGPSCVLSLGDTMDYYPDDSGGDESSMVQFLKNNGFSLAETIVTECLVPIGQGLAPGLISSHFPELAIKASGEVIVRLTNPVGWALVAFEAANNFGPFSTSYLTTSNNFAAYDLNWHGDELISVSPANGRPQPAAPPVELPVAQFSVSGTEGLAVTFDATDSTFDSIANPEFEWGLGDGSTPSGSVVQHTYSTPGLKNIRLTVYDGLGNSHETRRTVNVGQGRPPVIESLICSVDADDPRKVNLSAVVSDPDGDLQELRWYRSASDSTAYTTTNDTDDQMASITYPADEFGTFTPVLVAVDAMGNTASRLCSVSYGNDTATEAIMGRYLPIEGGGIIRDVVTGLEWQRCSVGQTWTGSTCSGSATMHIWNAAIELTAPGGFRIPTIGELRTIVYCSNTGNFDSNGNNSRCGSLGTYDRPTIVLEAFPNTSSSVVWSGSPNHSNYAWGVYFNYGSVSHGHRSLSGGQVRLVRVGQ